MTAAFTYHHQMLSGGQMYLCLSYWKAMNWVAHYRFSCLIRDLPSPWNKKAPSCSRLLTFYHLAVDAFLNLDCCYLKQWKTCHLPNLKSLFCILLEKPVPEPACSKFPKTEPGLHSFLYVLTPILQFLSLGSNLLQDKFIENQAWLTSVLKAESDFYKWLLEKELCKSFSTNTTLSEPGLKQPQNKTCSPIGIMLTHRNYWFNT